MPCFEQLCIQRPSADCRDSKSRDECVGARFVYQHIRVREYCPTAQRQKSVFHLKSVIWLKKKKHWAKHPTKCLDASAWNTNKGANLQIWSCDSMVENTNMQFLLPSEQGTIRWATHRNKCIDVAGGGTTTGTNIQMWECDDNDQNRNMQFTVRKPL